ncbi:MAG: UDP-glucose 4-epimerase GalE [Alphaproteobacteria bacterium]
MTKNILVTGGAGYIGSHVCKALSQDGFNPIAYDNLCTGNREAVKWGALEVGDILDVDRLDNIIDQYNPVAIMHFAALIQVGESVSDPARYYYNNVYGSYCLLEQARKNGIKNMVFSSTAAVYGIPQSDMITEEHPLAPINPYGATKLAMENMIRDYSSAYGLNYAILRYFNAAGADPDGELGTAYPKDTHIIPLLMQTATGERPQIDIFGTDYNTPDGTAIRDYIHVTDLARAHVLSLQHILNGQGNLTLNLGTSSGFSVRHVLETARQVTTCSIPSDDKPRREGDPKILVADANTAKITLNWIPELSNLQDIIKTAWEWQNKKKLLGSKGAFHKLET